MPCNRRQDRPHLQGNDFAMAGIVSVEGDGVLTRKFLPYKAPFRIDCIGATGEGGRRDQACVDNNAVGVGIACRRLHLDTTETKSFPTPVIPMATQAPPPNAPKATELPIAEVELPAPRQRIWPGLMHSSVLFRFVDPPPLDWQILDSDVIVVANFVSATAGVDTYEGPPAAYLPMHTLQFRASQYLKGTGPTEFTVEVLDYGPHTPPSGYLNREHVLDLARSSLEARNTQWDSRTGVLFLKGPLAAASEVSTDSSSRSPQSEPAGVFHLTNNDLLNQSAFQYTVDTLSRDWLPASEAPSSRWEVYRLRNFITPTEFIAWEYSRLRYLPYPLKDAHQRDRYDAKQRGRLHSV